MNLSCFQVVLTDFFFKWPGHQATDVDIVKTQLGIAGDC